MFKVSAPNVDGKLEPELILISPVDPIFKALGPTKLAVELLTKFVLKLTVVRVDKSNIPLLVKVSGCAPSQA